MRSRLLPRFTARPWVHAFDLLRELVARDMKLRYKRSALGFAWSLLNPLLQLLVISLVFGVIIPLRTDKFISSTFTGLIVWTWFQASLLVATGAIVDNRDLIRQPGVPVAVLPIVNVTTNLIHLVLSLPILFIFIAWEGGALTAALAALPLVIAVQYALTLGLAYIVAMLNVSFRDTQYLLGVALMLGFFLTPVFYDQVIVPERFRMLYLLNPLAQLVNAYRAILIRGQWPDAGALLALGVLAAALLAFGYRLFRSARYRFVEEL